MHNGLKTIRTNCHILIIHENGFIELYNNNTFEKETKNVADKYPKLVEKLKNLLKSKLH